MKRKFLAITGALLFTFTLSNLQHAQGETIAKKNTQDLTLELNALESKASQASKDQDLREAIQLINGFSNGFQEFQKGMAQCGECLEKNRNDLLAIEERIHRIRKEILQKRTVAAQNELSKIDEKKQPQQKAQMRKLFRNLEREGIMEGFWESTLAYQRLEPTLSTDQKYNALTYQQKALALMKKIDEEKSATEKKQEDNINNLKTLMFSFSKFINQTKTNIFKAPDHPLEELGREVISAQPMSLEASSSERHSAKPDSYDASPEVLKWLKERGKFVMNCEDGTCSDHTPQKPEPQL